MAPGPYREFFNQLSRNSPVCGMLQVIITYSLQVCRMIIVFIPLYPHHVNLIMMCMHLGFLIQVAGRADVLQIIQAVIDGEYVIPTDTKSCPCCCNMCQCLPHL